jgi:hypothetical protein
MTMTTRRSAALVSCLLVGCWSLALGSGVEAQASSPLPPSTPTPSTSTSYNPSPSTFSLTVSPTRLIIPAADLRTRQKITVINRGHAPVNVVVQKRNFTGGIDGSLDFQNAAPYAAATWVTVAPSSFTIAPETSQIVTADIKVPTSPEPGDHQVALVFLVPAGATDANIKINRGVATPVYITVPGATDDSVSLSNLHAGSFATGGPVTIAATVHNTGTVHRDFRGATQLKVGGAGATVFPDFTVVRDSTRDISTTWNPPLMCVCHPKVSVVDAGGVTHTSTIRVIVFPVPLAAIALGALVLLVLIAYLLRRRYRRDIARAAANGPVSSGDA